MQIRARDLFAGLGWDLAAESLGIESHGVELEEDVCESRSLNGLITIGHDVRDVNGAFGRYEIEIASPSCERFSITGAGDGRRAVSEIASWIPAVRDSKDVRGLISRMDHLHPKSALVLEPLRVLLENESARGVVWEQVPPVLPIWKACASLLESLGWSALAMNVDASWYGVPQSRKRSIMLARRDGIQAEIPGIQEDLQRVMGDVLDRPIDWIQRSNYSGPGTPEKRTAAERGRSMRTMQEKSVTITPKCFSWQAPDGTLESCSVLDQRRLQTFPDDVKFFGGVGSVRLQIGNAVPPRMAWMLLSQFLG